MTVARIKAEALALKPEQRIRLVQDIWQSLVDDDSDSIPVTAAHRKLLDERLRAHARKPDDTVSLSSAKQAVAARFTSRSSR